MRKQRRIAGTGDAGRVAEWERSRNELSPGESEGPRERNRKQPTPAPSAPDVVPEPRPPRPIPLCDNPDCSVCRGYRSRRYW